LKIRNFIKLSLVGLLLINGAAQASLCGWFKRTFCCGPDLKQEILDNLRIGNYEALKDKNIVVTCKKAPNSDVPSFGFGDGFLYPIRLCDFLENVCGANSAVCPPGPLNKFFETCSDLHVIKDISKNNGFIAIDCVDLLNNIPDFHIYECNKRFLSKNNALSKEATELAHKMKKSGIIPILITRQSSKLPKEHEGNKKFKYLDFRSMSRGNVQDLVGKFNAERQKYEESKGIFARLFAAFNFFTTPKQVRFYNIQFEDQKQPDIPGVEKPDVIYPQYKERRGAFVNDLVLMKAALDAGGQVVSVDTAAGNVAVGVPDVNDTRKNIKFLMAKEHNSRWKGKFVKPDGSSVWSQNIEIVKQKDMGDWSSVCDELVKEFKGLEGIRG